MIRTVFDTNTMVAAIINQKGYPAQILSAWRMGIIQTMSPSKFYEILKKLKKN